MKSILSIFILSLVITASSYAQTAAPNQSANLQEAAKIHVQMVQLFKQNKFDEALPLAKKVIELREKELKDDDHLLAVSHLNLANIYRAKDKYHEAEQSFRRALSVEEKRLGKEHADLYDLLINLGWVCHLQTKFAEAEGIFKRAISLKEKQRGTEHIEFSEALLNLAKFYQKIGKPEKSLPVHQRILPIKEKVFGEISTEYKEAVEQCGCAIFQINNGRQTPEGDKMWERAREIAKQLSPTVEQVQDATLLTKVTKRVKPQYPRLALISRLSGSYLIKILIDESGKVVEAKRLCGPDLFAEVSEDAARKSEFSPSQINGQPVKVQGTIIFSFFLL